MAYEVRRVDFRPPRPFTGFRVHHFGLWRKRGWAFPSGWTEPGGVAISRADPVVQHMVRNHGLEVLISRPEAFEEVVRNRGEPSPAQ